MKSKYSSPGRQQGAVTLFMSVIVLALITIVAFYTTRTVLFENKVQANNYRAKQAFEAAEAAYSEAVTCLNNGNSAATCENVTFPAGSNLSADVDITVDADNVHTVESTGYSEDFRAKHTIFHTLVQAQPLPNAPLTPITAKGGFIVNGSATVYNPEGSSTIWAGGDVDLGSNNSTGTYVANPADANYPACLDSAMTCSGTQSSNKAVEGLDVVESDADLANLSDAELFEHFFGFPMAEYVSKFATIELDISAGDSISSIDNAVGEVVYIETGGSLSIGSSDLSTVGCSVDITGINADSNQLPNKTCTDNPMKPTVVIINGDVSFSGNPSFYGLLYINGALAGNGTPTVEGAIVMTGSSGSGGSVDVWYNSDVLERLNELGDFFGLSGGWRDWTN